MSMSTVLLVGLSDLVSLRNAQAVRLARGAATFDLVDLVLFPQYNPLVRFVEGRPSLHDEIEPALRRAIEGAGPQLIIGSFWSNQHFFMSTANLRAEFDFVLPVRAQSSARRKRRSHSLRRGARSHSFLLRTAGIGHGGDTATDANSALSDAGAAAHRGFRRNSKGSSSKDIDAMVAEHGPAPTSLRYKFWRLVNTIHDELAAAANIPALPVPPKRCKATDSGVPNITPRTGFMRIHSTANSCSSKSTP